MDVAKIHEEANLKISTTYEEIFPIMVVLL